MHGFHLGCRHLIRRKLTLPLHLLLFIPCERRRSCVDDEWRLTVYSAPQRLAMQALLRRELSWKGDQRQTHVPRHAQHRSNV